MERYIRLDKFRFALLGLIIIAATLHISSHDAGGSIGEMDVSRAVDSEGGEYWNMFEDLSLVDDMNNITLKSNDLIAKQNMLEDFDSYSNNFNLIGTNGWKFVTGFSSGNFITTPSSLYYISSTMGSSLRSTSTGTEVSVISKEFNQTKGIVSFLMKTSKVDPSNLPTTQLVLLGRSSDAPMTTDRIVSIGFAYDSLGYFNGAWNKIIVNPSANMYYMIIVEFDCFEHTLNITVASDDGDYQGRALDVAFQNPWGGLEQLDLISCKKPGVGYIYSYYDHISLLESLPNPSVRIKEVSIGDDCSWLFLKWRKYSTTDMDISVSFLDPVSNVPYTGLAFDGKEDYLPLDFLNDKGIKKVKLQFDFKLKYLFSPILGDIYMEWNSNHAWRDSFFMDSKVGYLSGMKQDQGSLYLISGQKNGIYWSKEIVLPPHQYWDKVKYKALGDSNCEILIDILDPITNRSLPGFSDLSGKDVRIKDIDPIEHPSIKVRLRVTDKGSSPSIDVLAITWVWNTDPTIQTDPVQKTVKRTFSAPIRFSLNDIDQEPNDLVLNIKHRLVPGGSWGSDLLSTPIFDPVGRDFVSMFAPTKGTEVGTYEIMIWAKDEMGSIITDTVHINVSNNIPLRPVIGLSPSVIMRGREINVLLLEPGGDVETQDIRYDLLFYLDGVEDITCRKCYLKMDEPVRLPDRVIVPGKKLMVKIYTNDSADLSEEFNITTKVLNAPPEFLSSPTISLVIDEDGTYAEPFGLSELIMDPDGDIITMDFDIIPDLMINYEPSTDILTIVPEEDLSGDFEVPLTFISDQDRVTGTLKVHIRPVNDPPTGTILTEPKFRYMTGETVVLSASISDKDDPSRNLSVIWRMGEDEIGSGPSVNFTSYVPTNMTVSCYISDGKYMGLLGELSLSFVLPDPPFTPEEIDMEYSNGTVPVLFTVSDITGGTDGHRSEEISGINITKIGMVAHGRNVDVFMELKGTPLDVLDAPIGSTTGIWAQYRIYFVKGQWSEPAFDQSKIDLFKNIYSTPPEGSFYPLTGTMNGYLEIDEKGTLGGPTMSGNRIVWTFPMSVLVDSGITSGDMNLFGTALYYNGSISGLESGFDTAGHGSKDHPVVISEVKGAENDEDTVSMGLFLALVLILLIIIVVLIIAIVLLFMGRNKGKKKELPVPEKESPVQKMENGTPEQAPAKGPEKGPIPPEVKTTEPVQPPAQRPQVPGIPQQPSLAQQRIAQQIQALQMMRAQQQLRPAAPTPTLPPQTMEKKP